MATTVLFHFENGTQDCEHARSLFCPRHPKSLTELFGYHQDGSVSFMCGAAYSERTVCQCGDFLTIGKPEKVGPPES